MMAECGCKVRFGPGFCDEPGDFEGLDFCPLHGAANDMLIAAKAALADADRAVNPYSRLPRSIYEPLKSAIAKAESRG